MGQGSGFSIGDPDEQQSDLTAFDELLLSAEAQASEDIERHQHDIACTKQEEEAESQRQDDFFRIHSSAGTAFRASHAPKARRVEPYDCSSPVPKDHKGKQDSHSPGFGRMDQ